MRALIACHPLTFGVWGARAAVENLRAIGIEHFELPIVAAGEFAHFGTEPLLTSDAGEMQVKDASLAGVFNMGGAAVASYVSILERAK